MSMLWDDPDCLDFSELESRMTDFVDRSTVEENIKSQLAEFEMIQSMFSNPGEVILDDPSVILDLQEYSNGKGVVLPPQLDFHVYITIEEHKFEINTNLPLEYPTQEPDIFVRNDSLGRVEQHSLNEDLSRYITSLPRDEICILSGITWLQENALNYIGKKQIMSESKKSRNLAGEIWSRMWIYSHHIYSKGKRRELQELAQEFNLTGFCLPGRPGIICYEGGDADCEDCWYKVSMASGPSSCLKASDFQKPNRLNRLLPTLNPSIRAVYYISSCPKGMCVNPSTPTPEPSYKS